MKLSEELGFRRDFQDLPHEALLNVYYAASLAKKKSADFFHMYGITDVQFNLMMLLMHQGEEDGSLNQVELSRMMLVNRANITALIDRMEKAGLVVRTAVEGDRRSKAISLTARGAKLIQDVEAGYMAEIARIMGALSEGEMRELTTMLEKIRANLRTLDRKGKG